MEQSETPKEGTYEPVGVPAQRGPKVSGMTQGIIGIVCAVISLLFIPILFGLIGIILGTLALKKGEKTIGIVAIVLAAVFMVIGMILGLMFNRSIQSHNASKGAGFSGAVMTSLFETK